MRFYVASKFENKKAVQSAIHDLVMLGHFNTYDWTLANEGHTCKQALMDLNGVKQADFIVCLFENDVQYKGALVEFGVALALDKLIFVVGSKIDNMIFMELPNVIKISFPGQVANYLK